MAGSVIARSDSDLPATSAIYRIAENMNVYLARPSLVTSYILEGDQDLGASSEVGSEGHCAVVMISKVEATKGTWFQSLGCQLLAWIYAQDVVARGVCRNNNDIDSAVRLTAPGKVG